MDKRIIIFTAEEKDIIDNAINDYLKGNFLPDDEAENAIQKYLTD